MKPNKLKEEMLLRKEIKTIEENIREYLELFLEITNLNKADFYQYDYEYEEFQYDFSVAIDEQTEVVTDKSFKIILRQNQIILGKIVFKEKIKSTKLLKTILRYIKKKLMEERKIIKEIINDEPNLKIFIVSDAESKSFSKNLEHDINILFNANIVYANNLKSIVNEIEIKSSRNIILYSANSYEKVKHDEEILKTLNDYILVFGPNQHDISLLCGSLKIQHYIAFSEYTKETLKNLIVTTKNTILNKFNTTNHIISVSGISGGIGCTTIAMNMANILAKEIPNQNVLFIDLSHTKAVSNLFLEQNPLPEKSIIDLVNSDEFDLESNLQNGLVKIRENFYAINGIQKHLDREYLEKEIFVEKFLNYLGMANQHFNTIVIDTGTFSSTNLKTTVYDISNEIALIAEMNLPQISKLKTLYSLMKRAGLKDKISFILNRYDAKSSLSLHDVISILNMSEDEKMFFNYKLSNDYETLGKCWEQCELVSNVEEKAPFVREITEFLIDKKIIIGEKRKKEKTGFFSFFRK